QFYQELILPVMPYLATSGLMIVPHGLLHQVPFHAFHDGDHYLADLFDISYGPSGSVLKYCFERPDVEDQSALETATRPAAVVTANSIHMPVRVSVRNDN